MHTLLICTVGGSPEPVQTTLDQIRPDFVTFLCSGRDPATGRPGSDVQVLGSGDTPPSLRWPTEKMEVVRMATDDLDAAYDKACAALAELRLRAPEAQLFANYTGGTKTMSVALALAALDKDDVRLQTTTAPRIDCIKIHDGEQAIEAGIESARLFRQLAPARLAWKHYDYPAAIAILENAPVVHDARLNAIRQRCMALSAGFTVWDNGQYAQALAKLSPWNFWLEEHHPSLLADLERLVTTDSPPAREALIRIDLWRSAQRRARQQRYTDALLRLMPEGVTAILFAGENSQDQWQAAETRFISERLPDLLAAAGLSAPPAQLPDELSW